MSVPQVARVEPLTTARALRGPFDYLVPRRLADIGVGTVLLVPFGPRRIHGVVVELADRSELPLERLAEPIAALEAGATAELVELGLWIADEYCSTPARGLELVLPPGTGAAGGQTKARRELVARITATGREALTGDARLGVKQRTALELLAVADEGKLAAGLLRELGDVDRQTLVRLGGRDLIETEEVEVARRPAELTVGALAGRPELNDDQRAAVAAIEAAFDGDGDELLLHGVTGSGKTEVYLAAAEAALERGRGAIILVPEIGLTPQTLARFRARFGDAVAILHSKLSAGERRDEWMRLRVGEARICVGPRSAVFAPIEGLGLIVVDEEHDPSYKQEGDPRYDAREVAARRAQRAGAVLVAGTATPRPESWLELERLSLPERADGAAMPVVEILDMRERDGREGPLHARTRAALGALRDDGGKAIMMVPRRGWAPHVDCRECGHVWMCPSCDVSLVMHHEAARLRCHHCGHAEPVPHACPECGSASVSRHGAGSERVAAIVERLIEPLPVFRLDSDSAARKGAHGRTLAEFERAEDGVLVGTQMVSKGHDFPDVVLAVLIDADAGLRFPDLRAEERTFALVAQLAGRSGRGERGGRVLVQTMAPDAPAIRHAADHDAAAFLEGELARRHELSYPPYASLIRIDVSADRAAAADAAAAQIAARLRPLLGADAALLGPAPRFRVRRRERRQLLVKTTDRPTAVTAVRTAVNAAAASRSLRGVQLSVDVDPQ